MAFWPMTAMLDADMLTSKVQALRGGCHFAARSMLKTLIGGCLKQVAGAGIKRQPIDGFGTRTPSLG